MKRRASYIPHQSKNSVQDVNDYSTPEGTAQANEEMRRLNDKLQEIKQQVETAVPTTTKKQITQSGSNTSKGTTGGSGTQGEQGISGYSGYSGYSGASASPQFQIPYQLSVFHNEEEVSTPYVQGLTFENPVVECNPKYLANVYWKLKEDGLDEKYQSLPDWLFATPTDVNIQAKALITPSDLFHWVAERITYKDSVTAEGDFQNNVWTVTLVNDEDSPGNNKYYGTGASGYKGYHSLPTLSLDNAWQITGNALSADGTFGTTTAYDIYLKMYNNPYGLWAGSNTGIGYHALNSLTTGTYNTVIGYDAGGAITSGSGNVQFGKYAGHSIADGGDNVAIGTDSLVSNVSGDKNIAIGNQAGFYNRVDGNITLGYKAGYSGISGNSNIYIGNWAGQNNANADYNIGIGDSALISNTGEGSIGIGYRALYNATDNASQASDNVAVGNNAGDTVTTGYQNTFIGTNADVSTGSYYNVVAAGYNASADASNQVRLGNASITSMYCQGAYAATTANAANMYVSTAGQIMRSTSSRRYKKDIEDLAITIKEFMKLRPRKFVGKQDNKEHYGFIAEEIAEVLPDVVEYDKEGRPDAVQYGALTPVLTKILQEILQILKK